MKLRDLLDEVLLLEANEPKKPKNLFAMAHEAGLKDLRPSPEAITDKWYNRHIIYDLEANDITEKDFDFILNYFKRKGADSSKIDALGKKVKAQHKEENIEYKKEKSKFLMALPQIGGDPDIRVEPKPKTEPQLTDQIKKWMGWPTGKNWELIRDNFDDGLEALLKNFTKDDFAVSQITRISREIEDILDQKLRGMISAMTPGIYAETLAPYIKKAMDLSK
jgi:hypothetical protein